eukprot:m.941383 g.941383  ORF g.941383 m.941383 type:complete len:746 (-) comp23833_c0_seq4:302-2539(-)
MATDMYTHRRGQYLILIATFLVQLCAGMENQIDFDLGPVAGSPMGSSNVPDSFDFIGRFMYVSGLKQRFSLRLKIASPQLLNETNLTISFFKGVSWDAVYGTEASQLKCVEKEERAVETVSLGVLPMMDVEEQIRTEQTSCATLGSPLEDGSPAAHPSSVYFYRCIVRDDTVINVSADVFSYITISCCGCAPGLTAVGVFGCLNGDNGYFNEFSGERQWDLTVYIIAFVILGMLLVCHDCTFHKHQQRSARIASLLSISMGVTLISYFCYAANVAIYATRGWSSTAFTVYADLLWIGGEVMFAAIIILLAKGWSIYRVTISVSATQKLFLFCVAYSILSVAVLVWKLSMYNEARHEWRYDSVPARLQSALLILMWLYLTWAAYVSVYHKRTATEESDVDAPFRAEEHQNGGNRRAHEGNQRSPSRPSQSLPTQVQKQFIVILYYVGSMWFLAMPVVVLTLSHTASTSMQRAQYVLLAHNLQRLGGYVCLMVLWSPVACSALFPLNRRSNSVGIAPAAGAPPGAAIAGDGNHGNDGDDGITGTTGANTVPTEVLERRRALFRVGPAETSAARVQSLGQKARALHLRQVVVATNPASGASPEGGCPAREAVRDAWGQSMPTGSQRTMRETRLVVEDTDGPEHTTDGPEHTTAGTGYLTVTGVHLETTEDITVGPGHSPGGSRAVSEVNFLLTDDRERDGVSHPHGTVSGCTDDDSDTASVWERSARVAGVVHSPDALSMQPAHTETQ